MASGFRRHRYQVKLGKVKGYITRKPSIRALLIKSQAVFRSRLFPKLKTHIVLRKPFGARKPLSKALHIILQVKTRNALRPRLATHTILRKPFGYVTRKPSIRKLQILTQAISRKYLQLRIKTHTFFIYTFDSGAVTPVVTFPKKIQTVLTQRRLVIPKIVIQFTKVFGATIFPRRIQTLLTQRKITIPKIVFKFSQVFGYVTKNPPIRPLLIKSQAVSRSYMRPRFKTHSTFTKLFGGISAFISYGASFLFTASNWGTVSIFLEAYMKAIAGTVHARVLDETTGLPVTNSEISSISATFERIRSLALTLIDTHTYRLQLGKSTGSSGEILSGKLIIV